MSNHLRMAMFTTRFGHQLRNEDIFRTLNNAHSNKSQRGLYHGKTHGPKFKVSFSDKRHRYSQKPNVQKKKFYSDILEQFITLNVTTYAIKNVIKAGCFDNYILYTDHKKMNSQMGMYLRKLMRQKLKNPDFEVPYIPFQAKVKKRARPRPRYLRNMPGVYIPAHMKQTEDFSQWHEKLPSEMTRDEIADFQALMKDPDVNRHKDKAWKRKQPEFISLKKELLLLQPMRHDVIRKYWNLNKNSEVGRMKILKYAEQTEEFTKYVLEEDYIYYRDAIPEIDEFLEQVEREKQISIEKKRRTQFGEIQLRIGTKLADFNPFEKRAEEPFESVKNVRENWKA